MNQPIFIHEGDEMPALWRHGLKIWVGFHWLVFFVFLARLYYECTEEIQGGGKALAALMGFLMLNMIPGTLAGLCYPGKRLWFSLAFILPFFLGIAISIFAGLLLHE